MTAVATFLVEYKKDHAAKTADMVEMYARAHWIPFFGSLSGITKASAKDYARTRLTKATRVTVRKELSALRQFADFSGLDVEVAGLPKHGHPGRRHKYARKAKAIVLEPEKMERLLAVIAHRDFFRVLWETGLRQSTVFRLSVPRHWRKGSPVLFISRDIDKAGTEGELDLTPAAIEALENAAPSHGVIFEKFDLRAPLRAACTLAGLPQISPYDIRHSRLTSWANQPGITLPGFMGAARHTSLATSARYVQAQREQTRQVILGVPQLSAPKGDRKRPTTRKKAGK